MGNPGLADRFVGRPGTVPDHLSDHRRPAVFDQDNLEPVIEDKRFGIEQPGSGWVSGEEQRHGSDKKDTEAATVPQVLAAKKAQHIPR